MTADRTLTDKSDRRSVETAWVETLRAELPIQETDEPGKYVSFMFGNPVFTAGDVDPDTAVVLVDELLNRYPPWEYFDVADALSTEEWQSLKETLVGYVAEGVDGKRRGPMSAFPDGPAGEDVGGESAVSTTSPAAPNSPETPRQTDAGTPGVGVGLADEGFEPEELDMAGLYDAVTEQIEAADVDAGTARATLRRVRDDVEGTEVDLATYTSIARLVLASPADDEAVRRALQRAVDRVDEED